MIILIWLKLLSVNFLTTGYTIRKLRVHSIVERNKQKNCHEQMALQSCNMKEEHEQFFFLGHVPKKFFCKLKKKCYFRPRVFCNASST